MAVTSTPQNDNQPWVVRMNTGEVLQKCDSYREASKAFRDPFIWRLRRAGLISLARA